VSVLLWVCLVDYHYYSTMSQYMCVNGCNSPTMNQMMMMMMMMENLVSIHSRWAMQVPNCTPH
jgi:hypothetical protein